MSRKVHDIPNLKLLQENAVGPSDTFGPGQLVAKKAS